MKKIAGPDLQAGDERRVPLSPSAELGSAHEADVPEHRGHDRDRAEAVEAGEVERLAGAGSVRRRGRGAGHVRCDCARALPTTEQAGHAILQAQGRPLDEVVAQQRRSRGPMHREQEDQG